RYANPYGAYDFAEKACTGLPDFNKMRVAERMHLEKPGSNWGFSSFLVSCLVWATAAPRAKPSPARGAFFSPKLEFPPFMPGIYAHYMDRWERKLATRDTNRVVHPFEWGTDWLATIDFPGIPANSNGNSAQCLDRFVEEVLADTDRFYRYEPVRDYRLS